MSPAAAATWTRALARRKEEVARSRARYRAAIVGAYDEGMTPVEIAAALGVSGRRHIYDVLRDAGRVPASANG